MKNGADLKLWRKSKGYSQAKVAKDLGVSQRAVSNWEENATKALPREVEHRLGIEDNALAGEISETHSWPSSLFRELRRHALKSAKEVAVKAVLAPSRAEPQRFADFAAEIRFTALKIPDGLGLYLDHVRDPGDDRSPYLSSHGVENSDQDPNFSLVLGGSEQLIPGSTESSGGVTMEVVVRQGTGALLVGERTNERAQYVTKLIEHGTVRARLIEDQSACVPNFLAYEIRNADDRDPVSVFIHSDRGFNLSKSDAVGFAYYTEADFLVETIKIEVEFLGGLIPDPDPPSAHAQLIRRASLRPSSLSSSFALPQKEVLKDKNSVRYTFGPLLRPKGGFHYSLVWAKLSRQP
ncbi:MAG: helix-turn-helix transcriptional regulator [Verrucomicrobia bacterium]|nr:helix-turn-helix transcriptional regulator [Verrucomicrobiota bacterium]MBV8275285.1 helix-turn-helix transcriptional regulator [Verrucomicrobiota bacterium]